MAGAAVLERLTGAGDAAAHRIPIVWRQTTVRRLVDETPRARTLVLDAPGWPGHRPGQRVDVRLTADDGYTAQRSYSIASAPETDGLELTVERVDDGEVSPYLLDEVAVGDSLELRGPIGGHFAWTVADGGPLLLVAGGSGLVPLMAMLRHRTARGSDVEAHLLVSARTADDLLYGMELDALGPVVRRTYTRAPAAPATGWNRRVDAAMIDAVDPGPASAPHIFVCGPTPFVEVVAGLLVDRGHAPERVRTERFGPSG